MFFAHELLSVWCFIILFVPAAFEECAYHFGVGAALQLDTTRTGHAYSVAGSCYGEGCAQNGMDLMNVLAVSQYEERDAGYILSAL